MGNSRRWIIPFGFGVIGHIDNQLISAFMVVFVALRVPSPRSGGQKVVREVEGGACRDSADNVIFVLFYVFLI